MFIKMTNSSSDEIEASPKEEEKLTRQEKKIKKRWYAPRNRFEKYEVSEQDKTTTYSRKAKKKHKRTRSNSSKQIKSFDKSEAIFHKWFQENKHRFNTKPIAKAGHGYYFEGVIKNVHLEISWLPESMIFFDSFETNDYGDDNNFDQHVIDYIMMERYHPQKGYYDADRTDEVYDYFPTREALYINNIFEPIIEYCNEYITPKHSLYLFDHYGMTSAFIGKTDESSDEKVKRRIGSDFIDDLSVEECEKMFSQKEAYKIIKYDLFGGGKVAEVRYVKMKRDL